MSNVEVADTSKDTGMKTYTSYTPEEIIETLHSIKKLSVKDGELDVWQKETEKDYPHNASGISSFIVDLVCEIDPNTGRLILILAGEKVNVR